MQCVRASHGVAGMQSRASLCLVGLVLAAASFAAESQPPQPAAKADAPKAAAKKSEPTKGDTPNPAKEQPPAKEMEHLDVWAEKGVYEGTKAETKKEEPKKQEAKKEAAKEDAPAGGKFQFTGQVTVIRGTLRIDCEKMNGIVDPKTREVSRVIAVGDVKLLTVAAVGTDPEGKPKTDAVAQDAWHGTCSIADYDVKKDRIEMTALPGKPRPRLWRDKGFGEADKILFSPDKGEYELIGEPVLRGEMPAGPSGAAEKTPPAE